MSKLNLGCLLVGIGGIACALRLLDSPWNLIATIPLAFMCLVNLREFVRDLENRTGYRLRIGKTASLILSIGAILCALEFLSSPWHLIASAPLAIICLLSTQAYMGEIKKRKAAGNRFGNLWRLLVCIGVIVCAFQFLDSPWNYIVAIPFAFICLILLFSDEKDATKKAKEDQQEDNQEEAGEDADEVPESKRTRRKKKRSTKEAKSSQTESEYAKVLGLTGKVTPSEIKKKYLELMKQNHPDKVRSMSDEIREVAERRSKEINEAYEYFREKYGL
jgi:membrane protein implicated in regulation of membrane protease activity